mgnify:CR=1 FL=1
MGLELVCTTHANSHTTIATNSLSQNCFPCFLNFCWCQVALAVDNDVKAARLVKGRLEKTTLGQVARHIKIVLKPGRVAGGSLAGSPDLSPALSPGGPDGGTGAYGGGTSGPRIHGEAAISIRLDMSTIEALQLDIDGHTVSRSSFVFLLGGFLRVTDMFGVLGLVRVCACVCACVCVCVCVCACVPLNLS